MKLKKKLKTKIMTGFVSAILFISLGTALTPSNHAKAEGETENKETTETHQHQLNYQKYYSGSDGCYVWCTAPNCPSGHTSRDSAIELNLTSNKESVYYGESLEIYVGTKAQRAEFEKAGFPLPTKLSYYNMLEKQFRSSIDTIGAYQVYLNGDFNFTLMIYVYVYENKNYDSSVSTASKVNDSQTSTLMLVTDRKDFVDNSGAFTDEELNDIKKIHSEGAQIWFKVNEINPETEVKTIMRKAASSLGSDVKMHYIDITVTKTMKSDNVERTVTSFKKPLDLKLRLTGELTQKEQGTNRTYGIVRYHDGKAELLSAKMPDDGWNYLYFSSDKFSTYAVAYADKPSSANAKPIVTPTYDPDKYQEYADQSSDAASDSSKKDSKTVPTDSSGAKVMWYKKS